MLIPAAGGVNPPMFVLIAAGAYGEAEMVGIVTDVPRPVVEAYGEV
jgi:hypothetical protein